MSTSEPRMPAVFYGHGSPMNALGGPYVPAWRALGAEIPRPRAILMVSAHWYIDGVAVTAEARPDTIHDFYGFPPALFEMSYPAPGDPWLAGRVTELLSSEPVRQATDWGLDHGTWSVLVHSYPEADVPVVQLSLDRRRDGAFHYDLAKRLKPLRDEGVLIAGSGDVVHNLRLMHRDGDATPYAWAERFNTRVKAALETHDHAPLIDYLALGEDARLSAPTPEHYLPLLYVLAQQDPGERLTFFNDRIDVGSVSMLGVKVG
jgi:4,5-DOPA dioxygenase extradiol